LISLGSLAAGGGILYVSTVWCWRRDLLRELMRYVLPARTDPEGQ